MKQWFRWVAVAVWMGLIFFLSHQQGNDSSELSSGITQSVVDMIQTVFPFIPIDVSIFHHLIRKSAHFMAYLMLGLLVMYALQLKQPKNSGLALGICMLYAATDEFHQLFVPGRSGELRDVLIDSAGSATGIGIYFVIVFIYGRVTQRSRR